MYKTIKCRVGEDYGIIKYLYKYELIFHASLRKYVNKMIAKQQVIPYQQRRIHSAINKSSQWLLYQEAIKRYEYFLKHDDWVFQKSGIWSAKDVKILDKKVLLFFGKGFEIPTLMVHFACEDDEWEVMKDKRIVRIDVVHDDSYWFFNFLIEV